MEESKENNLSLEELIKENKELKDKNLSLLADIQNIKRIHNLEIENLNNYKNEDFAINMVEVANMFKHMITLHNGDEVAKGLNLVYDKLLKILNSFDIKPILVIEGETKFDYELHCALSLLYNEDPDKDDIIAKCEPLNTGWTYKDKIIKCPMVTVYTNEKPY
jgi:grpE